MQIQAPASHLAHSHSCSTCRGDSRAAACGHAAVAACRRHQPRQLCSCLCIVPVVLGRGLEVRRKDRDGEPCDLGHLKPANKWPPVLIEDGLVLFLAFAPVVAVEAASMCGSERAGFRTHAHKVCLASTCMQARPWCMVRAARAQQLACLISAAPALCCADHACHLIMHAPWGSTPPHSSPRSVAPPAGPGP